MNSTYARPERGTAQPKPEKGDEQIRRQSDRAAVSYQLKLEKAKAKARDGHRCRFPGCTLKLTLHSAHLKHQGRGNRRDQGDVNKAMNLLTLCARHHQQLDAKTIIRFDPHTPQLADGTGDWYQDGKLIATERVIGISVAVGD